MFNWLHHLLNPHCEHCAEERREAKVCDSCETLRGQLANKTAECDLLLDRLLNPPKPDAVETKPVEVTRPTRNVTWGVRRQMLEAEDKERAKLMNKAPKPQDAPSTDVEALEKELGVDDAVGPSDAQVQAR